MSGRGMKKWLSYKSLTNQADFLKAMHEERNIEEKPLISESRAEEINEVLSNYHNQEITMEVYVGEHVKTLKGIIERIDPVYKLVEINDMKIPFKNILKLN